MRRPGGVVVGGLLVALVAASCGTGPAAIYAMPREELAAVSAPALCRAYATAKKDRQSYPELEAEVASRGLGCERELAQMISDCSSLEVVSTESVPQGIVVTVRNNGPMTRQFRVAVNGVASSLQRVGPRTTMQFGIAASLPLRTAGAAIASRQQNMGVHLGECTVPYL